MLSGAPRGQSDQRASEPPLIQVDARALEPPLLVVLVVLVDGDDPRLALAVHLAFSIAGGGALGLVVVHGVQIVFLLVVVNVFFRLVAVELLALAFVDLALPAAAVDEVLERRAPERLRPDTEDKGDGVHEV